MQNRYQRHRTHVVRLHCKRGTAWPAASGRCRTHRQLSGGLRANHSSTSRHMSWGCLFQEQSGETPRTPVETGSCSLLCRNVKPSKTLTRVKWLADPSGRLQAGAKVLKHGSPELPSCLAPQDSFGSSARAMADGSSHRSKAMASWRGLSIV